MVIKKNIKMTFSITCIDALTYEPTIYALDRTIKTLKSKVDITRVYWFSDIPFTGECEYPVVWIKIPKFTDFQSQYSFITLELCPHICTEDFNLIIHNDGYAVNPDAWTDNFLNYDYIGAVWDDGFVGNGGFSLRSRKLYNALLEKNISEISKDNAQKGIPEDVIICRVCKNILESEYDIKFAPYELADRWSVENHSYISPWTGKPNIWLGASLGFHGKWGIKNFYNV
jgi:hypothetical protein